MLQDFNLLGALAAAENGTLAANHAGVDSANGHQVARLLRALATDDQRAAIIVTHDNRLHDIADRVLWLEDGALQQLGHPRHAALGSATSRRSLESGQAR